MKILQVVHSFVPYTQGGTEVYTDKLSRQLAKENQVFVFFRVNNPGEKEYSLPQEDRGCIHTYAINHTFNKCSSFSELYEDKKIDKIFADLLDEIRPDIVHIQHLLFLSLGIIREARVRNIPIVFTLHDYWLICHKGQLVRRDLSLCQGYDIKACGSCLEPQLSIKPKILLIYNFIRRHFPVFFLQLAKKFYLVAARKSFLDYNFSNRELEKRYKQVQDAISQVDLFIAPSNFLRNRFIDFGIPEDKILFYAYGMAGEKLRGITKSSSSKIRFGFIGTLLPTKGVDILIRAFKQVENNDIQLFIYGKLKRYAGYESYYDDLIKLSRTDTRIHFMNSFDNNNIDSILRDIDILVVPSIWQENAPLVVQEAVISQTPVIASRIGGIPDFIKDGINGLLFNPGDMADLKKKLEYLVGNREVIAELRDEGQKIKSIEDNAKELEGIYKNLCSKP